MQKRERIPSTVADPFQDNVARPFWAFRDKKCLADEFFDCYVSFKELYCQEYFWQWQSRRLDENLMKKLFSSYNKFFKDKAIGKDKFLTFMVDENDPKEVGRLYMSIILSNEFAKEKNIHSPPLFEVVHSAVSSDTLLHFMNLYNETVSIACDKFNRDIGPKNLSIIPTHDFSQESSVWFKHLHRYIKDYQQNYRTKISYIRPLIRRASSADNIGFVASVLATKRALSNYQAFSDIMGVEVYPIVQASVLPFRGNLSPLSIREFADTYPGARSVTISSSFRYDFDVEKVIDSVKSLNRALPRIFGTKFSKQQGSTLKKIEEIFAGHYKKAMKDVPDFSDMLKAKDVPRRLEKSFSLYSLGVPPEFIGAGNALIELIKEKLIKDLEQSYPNIKDDLVRAGRLLNKENLNFLAKTSPFWKGLKKEVSLVEDYVGQNLGPKEKDDFIHRNHTSNIFHKLSTKDRAINKDLEAAANARHSLG